MLKLSSKFKITILPLVISMGAGAVFGDGITATKKYRVEPITHVEDGAASIKKLYYNLKCSETAEQLLTEFVDPSQINTAVLVSVSPAPCSSPDRTRMMRFIPGRNSLEFVTGFDEVWYCYGYCQRPSQPGGMPQNIRVYAYGTSHEQAFQNIACNGYPASVQCDELVIDAR
jgi:hypothetical protein